MASEAILPVIIVFALLAIVGWLAVAYLQSTDEEAREYAQYTMQRLLFSHDAKYFAANLSERARPGYPLSQQRLIIADLTSLGTPSAPIKLVEEPAQSSTYPVVHFSSRVTYPRTHAYFGLTVARPNGRWQIDFIGFDWEHPSQPAPASL
jgi:hypothetical protein